MPEKNPHEPIAPADLPPESEDLHRRAREALAAGRFDLAEQALAQRELDLEGLVENLRIYQAELEIQNQELQENRAAVERALARFTGFFATLPLAELIVDAKGLILEANAAAEHLFELSASHLRQHFFVRLVAEPDRGALIDAFGSAWDAQRADLIEIGLRTPLGHAFTGDVHIARLPGEHGEAHQYVCAVIDRSDSVRQRQVLHDSAESLRRSRAALAERVKEQSCLYDIVKLKLQRDAAVPVVLQQVVERLPAGFGEPSLAGARIWLPDGAFASPGFAPGENRLEAEFALPDGGVGRVQVVYHGRDEQGERPGYLPEEQALLEAVAGHIESFLQGRAAEEALEQSRESYRILAEYSPEFEYWLGPDGHYVYISPACETLTGFPPAAFETDSGLLARRLHPADRPRYLAHRDEVLNAAPDAQRRDEQRLELRLRRRDGRWIWIDHVCTPVFGDDGRWRGRRGANRDITARKRAEAEAARMTRLYSTLSAANKAIVHHTDEEALLPEVTRIAVEHGGLAACLIQRRDPETGSMIPAAATYAQPPVDRRPAGQPPPAAAGGEQASPAGFGLSLPLKVGGALVGAKTVYSTDPDFFTDDVIALLEEMATDLAFALDHFAREAARARAEQGVQLRERQLAAIFRATRVGIGISLNRRLVQANDHWFAMTGYAPKEVLGQSIRVVYGDDAEFERVGREMDGALRETGAAELEARLRHKAGHSIDVSITAAPLDPAGGIVFSAMDITQRKRQEAELRRSRRRLEQAEQLANLGAWELDIAGRRLLPSPQWQRIHGTDAAEIDLDELIATHAYPDDRPAIERALERALAGDGRYEIEHRIRRGDDGAVRVVEVVGELERDAAGRPLRLVGGALDVTERKRAQQALLQSEERLRLTMAATNDGLWDWAIPSGRLTVNERWFEMLGYAPGEFEPDTDRVIAIIHPDDHPPAQKALEEHVRDGKPYSVELRMRRADGAWHWIHARGEVIARDADGGALRMVGTNTDIDARKQAERALRESHRRLTEAERLARLGHWELEAPTGRVTWSDEVYRIFGRDPSQPPPRLDEHASLFHPDDYPTFEALLQRSMAEAEPFEFLLRIRRADGETRYLNARGQAGKDASGQFQTLFGTAQDVTDQHLADEQVRQAAKVFESTADAVMITDAERCILVVNPAFTEITGYAEDEVVGKTPELVQSRRRDDALFRAIWAVLKTTGAWRGDLWNRRKDGGLYRARMTISPVTGAAGEVTNYIVVFSDITALTQSQERLDRLAYHDALTDLPNRAHFRNRLEHGLERAARDGERLAVLLLDLDRFKAINESFGPARGDELLCQMAATLAEVPSPGDSLARLGADEFGLLREDLGDVREAAETARRLLQASARPQRLGDDEVAMTASLGIAVYPEDGEDVETLLRHAGVALNRAKQKGPHVFEFFAPRMEEGIHERLRLENLLRQARVRGELSLHYQPQVRLADGALAGAEALLRWQSSELGPVSPGRFIPLAEELGLIGELGLWVFEQACEQLRAWDRAGLHLPRLAINVSIRQLELGDLPAELGAVLERTGVDPVRLELEITESSVMRDAEASLAVLNALQGLGLRLVIDDFGTGYSSLAYLRRLPLQQLKIDKSFVDDVLDDANSQAIARAIIALARSLGLETLAEGIERDEQAAWLRREDCELGQGYHFARPLPADELAAGWLQPAGGEG